MPPADSAGPPALGWSTENCTVGRAMAVLGERWAFLVLRDVFAGVRRFDDIRRRNAIPRQVLSDRLRMLVEHDVLRRTPYREAGSRERYEYALTTKGLDLYPVLVAINDWGTRHLADPAGASVEAAHRDCGATVHAALVCEHGHRVDDPRRLALRPGPGAIPV